MEINNPHDKFFKQIFSNTENVSDLIRNALPEDIACKIDYSAVKIVNSSFVDENFKESFSDLIVSVKIGSRSGYVYILIEHKSYPYRWSLFQMLKYMCAIWQDEIANNKDIEYLTLIVPILFYHGANRWRYGESFSSYFNDEENTLKNYIPHFKSVIYDLSEIDDENIMGNIAYIASIMTMKHIFTDIREKLRRILEEVSKNYPDGEQLIDFYKLLLYYIVESSDKVDNEYIVDTVNRIKDDKAKEAYMTVAEQLIEKGYREIIYSMSKKGLSHEEICDYTGFPIERVKEILNR
jgi:predicted transposase/invertase (TIGR01784 family)